MDFCFLRSTALRKIKTMKQTDFFFSPVVDLKTHHLPETAMNALHIVYEACKAINQPNQYGSSIDIIIIDAIHQDYDSPLHSAGILYDPDQKSLEAGLKVDLNEVLRSNLQQSIEIYLALVIEALDQVANQTEGFDFEALKADLRNAVWEETEVVE